MPPHVDAKQYQVLGTKYLVLTFTLPTSGRELSMSLGCRANRALCLWRAWSYLRKGNGDWSHQNRGEPALQPP